MTTLLSLALFATISASTGSHTWVKDNEVHVRFYDLSKVYGPVKFYVSGTSYPTALCSGCPSGAEASYVVPSSMVYQSFPQGGKYMEVTFPCSAVGGMQSFYFTAVSLTSTDEMFLGTGVVPNEPARGKR